MKKVFLPALAAIAALGGLVSSPSGQQVLNSVSDAQQQIEQRAQANRTAAQGQQASERVSYRVANSNLDNPYVPPFLSPASIWGGIPPKEYGEWLSRSGKNKYNLRKSKHYAKMRS